MHDEKVNGQPEALRLADDLRQAAQQALEALEAMADAFLDTEGSHDSVESDAMDKAYAAIDAARGENINAGSKS